MAYIRKTRDEYQIQTNYGYGWEVESRYETYQEARRDIGEYRRCVAHNGGLARIVMRRVRKDHTDGDEKSATEAR